MAKTWQNRGVAQNGRRFFMPATSTSPRLRVACAGLGWVATHRHLPVMTRDARYQVVGLIDKQGERAHKAAAQFGINRVAPTDDLSSIPWLDEVDAITISTNPFAHAPLIRAALEAGKHVLTEKPFVLDADEGADLVELARERGKTLGIVHNFQFSNSFLALQRDIARGKLGKLTSVQAIQFSNPRRRLPPWYDELPLGLFFDESPHLLYLLRALSPAKLELLDVQNFAQPKLQTPALLNATFRGQTKLGASLPISLSFNFVASVSEWQLLVWGERGCGMVDVFRDIYLRLPNDGLHTTKTVLRTSARATWQHWAQHFTSGVQHLRGELFYGNREVFARFAEAALRGQEQPRAIGGDDALAVLQLQHQIIERARAHSHS